MDHGTPPPDPGNHWHRTRRMTAWLMALWFAATFFFAFFARELAGSTCSAGRCPSTWPRRA
jgi:uncharacterized membrane protein